MKMFFVMDSIDFFFFTARWRRYRNKDSSAQLACVCLSLSHLTAIHGTKLGKIYCITSYLK